MSHFSSYYGTGMWEINWLLNKSRKSDESSEEEKCNSRQSRFNRTHDQDSHIRLEEALEWLIEVKRIFEFLDLSEKKGDDCSWWQQVKESNPRNTKSRVGQRCMIWNKFIILNHEEFFLKNTNVFSKRNAIFETLPMISVKWKHRSS